MMVTFVLGLSLFFAVTGSTEFNSALFQFHLSAIIVSFLINRNESRMNLWTHLSCFTDIDECELGTDICNGNAACTNNIGLYDCFCMDGYTGDGFDCRGNRIFHDW